MEEDAARRLNPPDAGERGSAQHRCPAVTDSSARAACQSWRAGLKRMGGDVPPTFVPMRATLSADRPRPGGQGSHRGGEKAGSRNDRGDSKLRKADMATPLGPMRFRINKTDELRVTCGD